MVDLHEELVGGIALRGRRNEVPGGTRQIGRRKQSVKNLGTYRIDRDRDRVAIVIEEMALAFRQRRHIGDSSDSGLTAKTFIVQEEEGLVLDDWTSQCPAELV